MTQVNHVPRPPESGISRPVLERILVGVDFRQPSTAAARCAATHFGSWTRIELAPVLSVPKVTGLLKPMMPALNGRLEVAVGSPLPRPAWFRGNAWRPGPLRCWCADRPPVVLQGT
jgi:hypothetical protein